MSGKSADVLVLGLGAMGSAVACELSRRGAKVLGLEQFTPAHDRGSSHGQTRIIRTAYYEHPDYVPMCRAAFAGWYRLEQEVGRHLLTPSPCLSFGPPGAEVVTGVERAASEHGLAVESFDSAGLRERVPAFRAPANSVAVLEQSAGFLYVEECVKAHLERALTLGATLHFNEPVRAWEADRDGVKVHTASTTYRARQLVITAGPWAGQLLGSVGASLRVMRQVVLWFRPRAPEEFRRDHFPIFLAETPQGHFYGLPMIDDAGVKIARHYGEAELERPEQIDAEFHPEDEAPVREFVREYLPGADGPIGRASVCRYTLTRDRHFVIDRHPKLENVVFAAGFSGHGFKFAPVVGTMLADLTLEGKTAWPLRLFTAGRLP